MPPTFVHLHTHSDYSLLEGLPKVDQLVAKAKASGMSALALTDSGVMYGTVEFFQAAKQAGLRPIIGMELWVTTLPLSDIAAATAPAYPLVLLAKNYEGYKNLLKLTSIGHLQGWFTHPSVDEKILSEHAAGIIALSHGWRGKVGAMALDKGISAAEKVVQDFQRIYGRENFYLEVQHHPGLPQQMKANDAFFELTGRTGAAVVATNDVHYIEPADAEIQDILSCIREKKLFQDQDRPTLLGHDFSFRSAEAMEQAFSSHPEALANTVKIAEQCQVDLELGKIQLPHYELPSDITAQEKLEQLCREGLRHRYAEITPEIKDRLAYELGIITKTGYASYFLIVQDFINWAKKNGIVVGPGRGSAAGSLVAYLTNITSVDPIKYELLFERFLNPERVSMPDIDTDFDDERRDDVIRYVESRYGKDHVAQIITFGTMAARAALRDVGRVLGFSYSYCDRIAKLVPMFTTLQKAIDTVPELKQMYTNDPDCERLLTSARKIEGVSRHTSIHACGVVITKHPLTEHTAIQYSTQGDTSVISQYSLHPVEDLGLLKMDFLGLKNLTIIRNTLDIIFKTTGDSIDIDTLPLDDQPTYKLLQKGQTTGVFQLESAGMKRYLKELRPTEFEDIVAMVALYRPGPMEFIPDYIARKHGKVQVEYIHESLGPLLKKTYGIILYQEQIMQIARQLSGFTFGEADVLRKAVGKKIKELLDQQEQKMVGGMVKNGIPARTAKQLWEFILPFARYGFNRSHAVCYAMIAYQTAYLKAHYPAQFMAALMTSDGDNTDRIAIEVKECRDLGIEVLPPAVNESFSTFTVVKESLASGKPRVRFGLTAIKNLGEGVTRKIISERKTAAGRFASLQDFLRRIQHKDLNKKSVESLIKSGALDAFGDRSLLLHNLEIILQYAKSAQTESNTGQFSLFQQNGAHYIPPLKLAHADPLNTFQLLTWEKELLGLYISQHPLVMYADIIAERALPIGQLGQYKNNMPVRIIGLITKVKKIVTKKGDQMLFATISDHSGETELLVFPKAFQETSYLWSEERFLRIDGKISARDNTPQVIVDAAAEITMEKLAAEPKWRPSDDFLRNSTKKTNTKKTAPADSRLSVHSPTFSTSSDTSPCHLLISLPANVQPATLQQLKGIFLEHPGAAPVGLFIGAGATGRKINTKMSISLDPAVLAKISNVVGQKSIKVYNGMEYAFTPKK